MKEHGSSTVAIRKRIKKMHSKAKFAGGFYVFGTFLLAVLTILSLFLSNILPTATIGGAAWSWAEFIKPFKDLDNKESYVGLIISILFAVLVLIVVLSFIACLFGKTRKDLAKKYTKVTNACNVNMGAMKKLGKRYSRSLSAIVSIWFIIAVLSGDFKLGLLGYITLGVGLLIHFWAGLVEGTTSVFDVSGTAPVELKRSYSMFLYFWRNLLQVVGLVAVLFVFTKVTTLGGDVAGILKGSFSFGNTFSLIALALQALLLVFALVLIKHTTNTTEFNRIGVEGPGMKNYVVFSVLTAIVAAETFVVLHFLAKNTAAIKILTFELSVGLWYVGIAVVMILMVIFENIFKSKTSKQKEAKAEKKAKKLAKKAEKAERKAKEAEEEETEAAAMMMPAVANVPPQLAAQLPPQVQMPAQAQQVIHTVPAQSQIQYVPMYYPLPYPYGGSCPHSCSQQQPTPPCGKPPFPAPNNAVVEEEEEQPTKKEIKAEKKQSKKDKKAAKKQAKKDKKAAKKQAKVDKKAEKKQKKIDKKLAKKGIIVEKEPEAKVEETVVAPVVEPQPAPQTNTRAFELRLVLPPELLPSLRKDSEARAVAKEDDEPVLEEVEIRSWQIRCPNCGKLLEVKDSSAYHRCPACAKVFQLSKSKKGVIRP